jgi:hypothetical protein
MRSNIFIFSCESLQFTVVPAGYTVHARLSALESWCSAFYKDDTNIGATCKQ